jgi:hypothetical protein
MISSRRPRRTAGDLWFRLAVRLSVYAKVRASTGAPVWKRKVRFSSKMYVRPFSETLGSPRATSGTTCDLPVSESCTVLNSFAHVANSSVHEPLLPTAKAGSM